MQKIYDVIGIGFGPSNLAVAICLNETDNEQARQLKCLFFEKQESFNWHKGALLEGATLQVSFLKDLVTLRNPASNYSFISYLKHMDRLEDFINLKTFYPTRFEYNEYLKWVAHRLKSFVKYGSQVEKIELIEISGEIKYFDVTVRDCGNGDENIFRTRNLIVAQGLSLKLPPNCELGARVFHSSQVVSMLENFKGRNDQRFLVVGAGQSAAESVNGLYENFPDAKITAIFGTFGYKPADSSSFVNQIFDEQGIDYFYDASDAVKVHLMHHLKDTNYGVVDVSLIEDLYRKMYADKVNHRVRLTMRRLTRLKSLSIDGEAVSVQLADLYNDQNLSEKFDGVVLATGYEPARLAALAPALSAFVECNEAGDEVLGRNYAVKTNSRMKARIYMQGTAESQHGLTSTLLSALAIRSGEIVEDLCRHVEASCTGIGPNSKALSS